MGWCRRVSETPSVYANIITSHSTDNTRYTLRNHSDELLETHGGDIASLNASPGASTERMSKVCRP